MREVAWSLAALMLTATACGSSDPDGTGTSVTMDKDGGSNSRRDAGANQDGGKAANADAGCGRMAFQTGATSPDMLIVLDRSGSMKPVGGPPPDQDCRGFNSVQCALLWDIDCTNPAWAVSTYCGGMQQRGPVDRWTPSVSAIDELTAKYDSKVAFGLMTFPALGKEDTCPGNAGDFQVEIATGTSKEIATKLAATSPGGNTPTGQTLEAARQYFLAHGALGDAVKPAQYVLLVTDGQPTCPNSDGMTVDQAKLAADLADTLATIDKLTQIGVKTFVVGYDAKLDLSLADALTQMAMHGGTKAYFPVQDAQSLSDAFAQISANVTTCSFQFPKPIPDPSFLHVTLDTMTLKPSDPNGFSLDSTMVTIRGASCDMLLTAGQQHVVEIALECTPPIYQ